MLRSYYIILHGQLDPVFAKAGRLKITLYQIKIGGGVGCTSGSPPPRTLIISSFAKANVLKMSFVNSKV